MNKQTLALIHDVSEFFVNKSSLLLKFLCLPRVYLVQRSRLAWSSRNLDRSYHYHKDIFKGLFTMNVIHNVICKLSLIRFFGERCKFSRGKFGQHACTVYASIKNNFFVVINQPTILLIKVSNKRYNWFIRNQQTILHWLDPKWKCIQWKLISERLSLRRICMYIHAYASTCMHVNIGF